MALVCDDIVSCVYFDIICASTRMNTYLFVQVYESYFYTTLCTISNQLSSLAPTFDPAKDSVDVWSSKVELLAEAWPANKLKELATHLIFNCSGTAYQKLRLHQKECLTGDTASIKRVVELVGGAWGQAPLEKRYDLVERAVFRAAQKSDETGDSYIARMDVVWTEMLEIHHLGTPESIHIASWKQVESRGQKESPS